MEVLNLIDYPEYIEEVSEKIWNQWQKNDNNGLSLEDTIKRSKNIYKKNNGIPSILIALDGIKLIGTISLWINDINCRQDLFPFVASFYVEELYRKKGVGKKLIEEIERLSLNNGWNKIYLSDASGIDNLYEKYGYTFLENDSYRGENYRIYYKKLKNN